ncbi:MAG: AN1-type zinc finger domain-containing protein [Candidatus Thorarchaeota archaeon]
MAKCDFPDCDRKEALPFKCSFCGGLYCTKHRLPENHNCSKLELAQTSPILPKEISRNKQSPTKTKEKITVYDFNDDESADYYATDLKGNVYSVRKNARKTRDSRFLSMIVDSFTTGFEVLDIIIGILIVMLSYGFVAITMSGLPWSYSGFIIAIIVSCYLTIILPPKFLAKRYGCTSRYVLTWIGLLLTLITVISPIKVLNPGTLLIPEIDLIRKKYRGLISASGQTINTFLGIIYLFLGIFLNNPLISMLFLSGAFITSQLTFFMMLPFPRSYAKKVLEWNWIVFAILLVISLGIAITTILFGVMGTKYV